MDFSGICLGPTGVGYESETYAPVVAFLSHGVFLSHGMIIHLGGENGGSVFLQSMVYSLEAEPGGHPVLCLCLQSAICDQNKFIFFINYIFSNFFVPMRKKKSSNPMPLVGTSLSTLQYPNIQHDSWHAARLQFLLSIDQRGSLD